MPPANRTAQPRRTQLIAGGAIALTAAGLAGYFAYNNYRPSTNDAYVHAYTVTV